MQALWPLTAEPGTWELRPTIECLGQECAALGLVEPAGQENTWRLTAAGQDAWRHLSANPPPDPHRVREDQDGGPAYLPSPAGPRRAAPSMRPGQVAPIDIWRAAKILVDQHGADAPVHAALRIDELDAAGDDVGRRVWRGIPGRHRGTAASGAAAGRHAPLASVSIGPTVGQGRNRSHRPGGKAA